MQYVCENCDRVLNTADEECECEREYRATHSPDGYMLGSEEYPNNREGRRALKQSWRGLGVNRQRSRKVVNDAVQD